MRHASSVQVCTPTAVSDPAAGFSLSPGCHMLNGTQAVDYVMGVYGINPADSAQLIDRQQELASALFNRAKGELYNPVAIYRFLDAVTKSLTVDSQLGGLRGLFDLIQRVRSIPESHIVFFGLPSHLRAGTATVAWSQPAAYKIFTDLRHDVAIPSSLAHGEPMCSASQGSHC